MTSQYNKTALMWAAQYNAGEVAKLLIDKGRDVNVKNEVWYFCGGSAVCVATASPMA